ncbi:hypothetical protein CTI12_AA281990 [Artemisia annua]|uniref:Uncharacterized protein n=1 Tax=Artemisia annua TaxID=35608 RepID=A0A2U1NC80_ARTAN|nr:hypothetical protein CTI12_AA281990 [Artemisia annua]
MAGDNDVVINTPPTSKDKIIPFSISNNIPIKLSLEKHIYNLWSSFLKIHLGNLGLIKSTHLREPPQAIPTTSGTNKTTKDAHAITLDNELRTIKLGNLSINAYCPRYKVWSIVCTNGLDKHFKGIVHLIRHREPLPTFETTRNMLLLKESTLMIPKLAGPKVGPQCRMGNL